MKMIATILTLAVMACAPAPAFANDYHDLDAHGIKVLPDLVFLRTTGLVATALGTVLFVPLGTLSLVFTGSAKPAFRTLVLEPASFTFAREFESY